MPNYDYKCPECDIKVIESRPMAERHDGPLCFKCGHKMPLQMSPVGSTWRTHGQHRDEYTKTGPRKN